MQAIALSAKLALYSRQIYLSEVTRGIAFVLIADLLVRIMLKRAERHRDRLIKQVTGKQSHYARARA